MFFVLHASLINNHRWTKFILIGFHVFTGLVTPYTGFTSSSSCWKVPKSLSQNINICERFLSMYSLLIAWCTRWCEGVTMICSRKPILPINWVWYQYCKNRWSGATMAITYLGTPSSAAGMSKKVKKFIKFEIDWRNAQERLNSSLLWWMIW